jgi:uncharacterized tellurite resistance protein B-like protein
MWIDSGKPLHGITQGQTIGLIQFMALRKHIDACLQRGATLDVVVRHLPEQCRAQIGGMRHVALAQGQVDRVHARVDWRINAPCHAHENA